MTMKRSCCVFKIKFLINLFLAFFAVLYAFNAAQAKTVMVRQVGQAPELDGDDNDPAWKEADTITVKDAVAIMEDNDYRFSALVTAIVTSDPFTLREAKREE